MQAQRAHAVVAAQQRAGQQQAHRGGGRVGRHSGARAGRRALVGRVGAVAGRERVAPAVRAQAPVPVHRARQGGVLQRHHRRAAVAARHLQVGRERHMVEAVGRAPGAADGVHAQVDAQRAAGGRHVGAQQVGRAVEPPARAGGIGVAAARAVVVAGGVGGAGHHAPRPLDAEAPRRRGGAGGRVAHQHAVRDGGVGHVAGVERGPPAPVGVGEQLGRVAERVVDDQLQPRAGRRAAAQRGVAGQYRELAVRGRERIIEGDRRRVGGRGPGPGRVARALVRRQHQPRARRQRQQQPAARAHARVGRRGGVARLVDREQHAQPRAGRQAGLGDVQQRRRLGGVHRHQPGRALVVHPPRHRARARRVVRQHGGRAAAQRRLGVAQRGGAREVAVQRRVGIEAVGAAAAPAGREHRGPPLAQALLGAVVDDRDARQRHQRQQALAQAGFAAAGQEAVHVVVVEEARHPVQVGMQRLHRGDAVGEGGGGPPAREHLVQRAVQREVDHPRQHPRAVRPAHVALDAARAGVLARAVDPEALAEHVEVGAPGGRSGRGHAGRVGIGGVHEVGQVLVADIEGGVHAERVHAHLADPVRVGPPERLAHHRVGGVEVVQPGHLAGGLLHRVGVIGDVAGPVVDAGGALRRVARVVERERPGRDRGRRLPGVAPVAGRGIGGIEAFAVAEVVAHVVEHHVLHQVHPAAVQTPRQRAVVGERAEMRVHRGEVGGPVAVVAAVAHLRVPPLVGHRRGDPHRGGAEAADVVQPPGDAGEVAAAVARVVRGVVLAGALVVVARVAVVEAVGQHEVDDLVAPVGRGHVQRAGVVVLRCHLVRGRRRRGRGGGREGEGERQRERGVAVVRRHRGGPRRRCAARGLHVPERGGR